MLFSPDLKLIWGSLFQRGAAVGKGITMGAVYPSCTPGSCAGPRVTANKLWI